MKKKLFNVVLLVVLAFALTCMVSCSKAKADDYPAKYVITEKTWDSLLDYAISSQGLTESDLAYLGGKEGLKSILVASIGDAFNITLLDKENIKVEMGEVIEATYEISGSSLYVKQINTGEKVLLGTLSKDRSSFTFNTALVGYEITLYKAN